MNEPGAPTPIDDSANQQTEPRSYLSEQYAGPEFSNEERRESEAENAVEKLRMAANTAREVGETEVADILDKQADERAEAMREFYDVSYEEGLRINEQATVRVAELITEFTELNNINSIARYTSRIIGYGDFEDQGERQVNDVAWQRFLATILPSQQLDAFQEYAKYKIRQCWAVGLAVTKLSESDRRFVLSGFKLEELMQEYEQEHPAPEYNPTVQTRFGDEVNLAMPDYDDTKRLLQRDRTHLNWQLVVMRNIHPQLLLNFAVLKRSESE